MLNNLFLLKRHRFYFIDWFPNPVAVMSQFLFGLFFKSICVSKRGSKGALKIFNKCDWQKPKNM